MALVSNIPTNILACCNSVGLNAAVLASSATLGTSTNHKLGFTTNDTLRATLDTSGNLGIGTDSPGAKLDVRGTVILNEAGGDYDVRMEGDTDANLFFLDASTDRIGIGTATPSHLLDVEGVANFATCIVTPTVCTTGNTVIGGDLTVSGDDITLGTNTSGYILVADGTNYNPVAMSGDITIDNAGTTTIGATKITNAMLAGSIANDKLSNSTVTLSDGSSTTAIALGGTMTFSGTSNEVEVSESSGTLTIGLPSTVSGLTTISATNLTGTLSTAAQANVTSVGTLSSLAVSGDITVDTTTLKVNSTTNRVGIGTATPSHLLDVEGVVNVVTCVITPVYCVSGEYALPAADGTAGLVMCTDGSGALRFAATSDTVNNPGGSDTNVQFNDGGDFGGSANFTWDGSVLTVATHVSTTCLTGTLQTAAQANVTSLGTLSALTVSGDVTIDTTTLKVDSTNNRVGIGTASPSHLLDVEGVANVATCIITPIYCVASEYVLPSADGSAGQVMCTDGSGALAFATNTPTSPGGSDTYVQFNDSDSFGGSANLTWDDTTLKASNICTAGTLTIGGATQFSNAVTVGVDDTGYDVKFFGATSGRYLLWDEGNDRLKLRDNTKVVFGQSNDLEIYHDATDSVIKNSTGKLKVLGDKFRFNNAADNESMLIADADGAVKLYYNGSLKMETTNTGVDVTGDLTISGDDLIMGTNTSGYILVADGTNYNPVAVSGDVTISSAGAITIAAGAVENSMLANCTVSYGGVQLVLGGTDATPAFDLTDATNYPTSSLVGTITNAQLAGSIANDKLSNSSVSFGGVSVALGATDATPAFDLSDATSYPTSSLVGTITNAQLAGSIVNAKLVNDSVSFGGVSVDLGASDATPAFDLSDATAYTGDSSLVTVGTITSGTWQGTAIATGNIAGTLTSKTLCDPVLVGTISGNAFLDEDNMASDSASKVASQQSIKAYVDSVASGLDMKCSSHVATTANLTASYNNGSSGVGATLTNAGTQAALSIDGQTLASSERVLIKNQTAACHNGIYSVTTVGDGSTNWVITRTTDFDSSTEVTSGAFTFVETGSTNGDHGFVMTSDGAITIGTTAINWTQFSGAGQITAGAGMTKSGDTLNVIAGDNITVNADDVALSTAITGITSISSTCFTGTLQTAAQANITSVGTLTSLCSSGDITLGGDLTIAGDDLFMATNTSGYILVADGTNYNPVAVSGDVTISSAGAITIAADAVENSMLANCTVSYGGVSLALGGSDATPAFDLADATNYPTSSLVGTITNTQLAGSIANAKLANSTITVSDGSNTTAIALGGTATFSGTSNEVEVAESSGTVTIGLPSTVSGLTTVSATNLTGTLSTAAQANVTSVGTLTSLAVSGDITIDTTTLKVNSTTNRVGIGTATPSHLLDVEGVANVATCIITPIYCVASEYVLPSADGTAGQVMCTDGSGGLAFATNTPASPGGSDTYVQFNDGSSFGGSANFTWDDTTVKASNFCTAGTATLATVDINAGAIDGTTIGAAAAAAITGTTLTASGNVSFDGGTFVFNEAGADKDFRIEGDSEQNLFIADASVDRIGIGTATPSHLLDIEGVGHAATCFVSADVCATTKVVSAALCVGSEYALPTSDGSAGQILCTDGSGTIAFAAAASSGHTIAEEGTPLASRTCLNFIGSAVTAADNSGTNATDVTVGTSAACIIFTTEDGSTDNIVLTGAATVGELECDSSPALGGNLDVNGNSIVSASNGNIPITPNGTGIVIVDGICHPTADGSAGQVLCTNGSAALQWATVSTDPAGSDTYIQFNNGGAFGAAAGLTWDDTTFKASNICTAGTATIATVTATSIGGTLTTAAQANITSVGTLTALTVSGNVSLNGGTFVFNEAGADKDFRIEGDSEANLFISDASVDRIGIGTATPSHLLDIEGVGHAATCFVSADLCATTKIVGAAICMGGAYALPTSDGTAGYILCTNGSGAISFAEAASSGHTIAEDGSVLTDRTCLNFCGAAVTVTDCSSTNSTDVQIRASGACLPVRVTDGTQCFPCLTSATIAAPCLQCDSAPKLGGDLDVNGNSIISASNGNIPITPNGSGIVIIDGICHPIADGSAGQLLCTDGSAALKFATAASGGHTIAEEGSVLASRTCLNFVGSAVTATDNSGTNATDVTVCATSALLGFRVAGGTACCITLSSAAVGESLVSDTTPQLGGNLDVNGNSIVSDASNENIPITPHGTGSVVISKMSVTGDTSLDGGSFVFNESGADKDFRIEGDTAANLFIADASTDRIGIGTATPSHLVDIEGVGHASTCFVSADLCATTKVVSAALCVGSQYALPAADGSAGQLMCTNGSGALAFATASAGVTLAGSTNNTIATVTGANALAGEANLTFDGSTLAIAGALTATGNVSFDGGSFVFNEAGADKDFRIEGDTQANLFVADASTDRIGIGTATPATPLHVYGAGNVVKIDGSSGTEASMAFTPASGNGWQLGAGPLTANSFQLYENTAAAARITVLEGGKVGIGTVAPATLLHAEGSTGYLKFDPAVGGNTELKLTSNSGNTIFGTYNGSHLLFYTDSAERMVITTQGSVGIATTNPYADIPTNSGDAACAVVLKVGKGGTSDAALQLRGYSDDHGLDLWSDVSVGNAYIDQRGNHDDYDLHFRTKTAGTPVSAMTIQGNGTVLIGNTIQHVGQPGFAVTVDEGVGVGFTYAGVSNSTVLQLNRFDGTGDMVSLRYGTSEKGTISTDGSNIAYNTSSDYRLKENIIDLTGAITRVKSLQPRRFNFIEIPDVTKDGFIAHEAAAVVPEAVTGTKDATKILNNVIVDSDGVILDERKTEAEWTSGKEDETYAADTQWHETLTVPEYQGIDQAKLVPLLTAAIQELTARLEAAEAEIAILKG